MKNLVNILKDNIAEYSGYIITDRVLPNVEDGLKPSQLRILWTMNVEKATKLTKSGNITGNVFKYHPHGNTYSTLVNMTQKDKQNVPYIIGKGNFGQHTSRDLQCAAERYTECKLSDLSIEMLDGIKGNTVEFVDNFDGTLKIPKYLPTKFPSVLAFANSGIALGMSSSIPSFNISELCSATIKYLKTGEKELLYPDFATGGYIIKDESTFKDICETGKGSIRLRGKCEIDGNSILIKEIPYTTTREAIIDKIISLVKEGKLPEITSVKDLTGIKGLCVDIQCKRGTDKDLLIEKLYKFTPLESSYSANMNVLVDGKPRLLGVYGMVDEWYKFRVKCLKNNLKYEMDKLEKELHLLHGLEKVLLDIDLAIDIIRNAEESELHFKLNKAFGLDEKQAEYVCGIKLRNINKDYIQKQLKEINGKYDLLGRYKKVYNSESLLQQQVIKGLEATIKKHGVNAPRKTELIEVQATTSVNVPSEIVENYNVKVILTKEGYFKKVRLNACKGENKLKDNDEVIFEYDCKNTDEIVFLGDDLNAHKFKVHEFEDMKLNTFGLYMVNQLDKVKPLNAFVIGDNKYLLITYKERMAKIHMESYVTTTNRRKLKNSLLNTDIVDVMTLKNDIDLEYTTKKGKVKQINTAELLPKGKRDTQGVKMVGKDEIIKVNII